jgi:hypothetical protein
MRRVRVVVVVANVLTAEDNGVIAAGSVAAAAARRARDGSREAMGHPRDWILSAEASSDHIEVRREFDSATLGLQKCRNSLVPERSTRPIG